MDATKITEALGRLDPENSEHWTSLGLPNLEALNAIMLADDPLQDKVRRKDVDLVHPNFERDWAKNAARPGEDVVQTGDETAADAKDGDTADETEQSDADEDASESENKPQEDEDGEKQASSDKNESQEGGDDETPAEVVEKVVTLDDAEKEDRREELNDELGALENTRQAAKVAKDKATQAIDVLDGKIAKVQDRMDGEVGKIPLSTALRHFINSSHRERMRHAGRIAKIDELAGVKTNLTAKAPIDASMERKRGRGKQRVQRSRLPTRS